MEAEVAAGLNLKNRRIKKIVEGRAANVHLPAGSDPGAFGFFLNPDHRGTAGRRPKSPRGARCFGLKKQTSNVRLAPKSGHWRGYRGMSAFDPKRTLINHRELNANRRSLVVSGVELIPQ